MDPRPEPGADSVEQIREEYLRFAARVTDSPCFEEWSRGAADDLEVLEWIASLPVAKRQPNLVFAAARWHGVPAPSEYADLRAGLLGDEGRIRETVLARATQTNEAGRLATLLPAFDLLSGPERAPLALIEVGASAGLCLFADRWGYAWTTEDHEVHRVGPPHPRLVCEVEGPAPLPDQPLPVAWRAGLDLHPLDVADHDAMLWLSYLVWPEHADRRATLAQAIAVARDDPPRLVQGDLLEDLPALVAEAAPHGRVVVFHSAVAAYLDAAERERFTALMTGLVTDGACHWVSNEGARVLPRVTATVPGLEDDPVAQADLPGFVLGIDGRAVATTQGHGRRLHWFGRGRRADGPTRQGDRPRGAPE